MMMVFVKTGRGAINRVSFISGKAIWKRALIKTPSILMADALEGTKHAFKMQAKSLYKSNTLGYMNTCNTSALSIQDGRMALTFEGGCHWEFDPETLQLVTPIGRSDEWRSGVPEMFDPNPFFKQVRTTAHPYFDKEKGELLTLNYGTKVKIFGASIGTSFTNIVRFWGRGDLEVFEVYDAVTDEPVAIENNAHSFLVTRNYIGVVETPAVFEPEKVLGMPGDHTRKMPTITKIWWVKRSDLQTSGSKVRARLTVLDMPCIDLVANFNDDGDVVTILSGSINSFDISEFIEDGDKLCNSKKLARSDLLGYSSAPFDRGGFVRYEVKIDDASAEVLTSQFREEPLAWGIEFPAYAMNFESPEAFDVIYWSTSGLHQDQALERLAKLYQDAEGRVLPIDELPKKSQGAAIIALDCHDLSVNAAYQLPVGHVLTSLQFVPKASGISQKDGYLLAFVHYDDVPDASKSSGQEVWIFDAKALKEGPICQLGHSDINIGTTLHSTWTKEIRRRNGSDYQVDLAKDYEKIVVSRPKEVKEAWDKVLESMQ